MDSHLLSLLVAAVTIAATHTFIGVDHYLPFVVLGRARNWSLARVLGVTALCGIGHVIGSVVLGFVGIGLGMAVGDLVDIESVRGSLAAWGLIAFGLVYATWAAVRIAREHRHSHVHAHATGALTLWAVFIVFVLGPCEPLIPLLMAPAWSHNWTGVAAVAGVFSITTIGFMMGMAAVGYLGLRMVPLEGIQKYAHVMAGVAIFCSGAAIELLGV